MARPVTTLEVVRTEQITPHMVRVVLGGNGFDDFKAVNDTDAYVKIIFPPRGVSYDEPFDIDAIREQRPQSEHPILRTYTVRAIDTKAREISIDFVVHGDDGIAGPWAANAQPGETVRFHGPGSGYRPDATAPWHLLASDEAGLPALAAALEAMPNDAVVKAFIEVASFDDQLELAAPDNAEIHWIYRGVGSDVADESRAGDNAPLVAAVRSAEWLDGEPQVFIHGEAHAVMQNLRRYVRREKGVSAARASISGYWRRGRTEEGFRQWKAEQRAAEEAQPVN